MSGGLVSQNSVQGVSLIDALSFDQTGQSILIAAYGSISKRIEIWQAALTSSPSIVSVLPEGVGQTGWAFHNNGTLLLSRNGRVAEVFSGKVVRDNWIDWGKQ